MKQAIMQREREIKEAEEARIQVYKPREMNL
jgi:hypothetical protein